MVDGGAFAWVNQLAEWLGAFFPRLVILDTTESAVKFVRGRHVKVLGPGVHCYWPLLTKLKEYPTARQPEQLREQTFVTTDDKTIAVGGIIVYEVTDISRLVAYTWQGDKAVKDIALSAVHDVCCKLSWSELKDEQRRGTLDTKLKNQAQKDLESYGVKVLKVMLTDLAPTRVFRLVQSQAAGEET